jgi:hypothetical protein
MFNHLVLAVKKSHLADITSFARYSFNRGRDWYLRNRRLPRIAEFSRLLKRAAFEYQIRRRQGLNDLSCPAGFELPEALDPYQCWIVANRPTDQSVARLRDRLKHRSARLPKCPWSCRFTTPATFLKWLWRPSATRFATTELRC